MGARSARVDAALGGVPAGGGGGGAYDALAGPCGRPSIPHTVPATPVPGARFACILIVRRGRSLTEFKIRWSGDSVYSSEDNGIQHMMRSVAEDRLGIQQPTTPTAPASPSRSTSRHTARCSRCKTRQRAAATTSDTAMSSVMGEEASIFCKVGARATVGGRSHVFNRWRQAR